MRLVRRHTIRLEMASRLDFLDAAQAVLAHVSQRTDLDEDARHYVSVALRESLINAIKHGNLMDERKRVRVSFMLHPRRLELRVQDEGAGFNPHALPDPCANENLLRTDGRGVFFIRSFMDEVKYSFPRTGGTLVRMIKRLPAKRKAPAAARSGATRCPEAPLRSRAGQKPPRSSSGDDAAPGRKGRASRRAGLKRRAPARS
jgi:serine/threonine-protein kinase RsbW